MPYSYNFFHSDEFPQTVWARLAGAGVPRDFAAGQYLYMQGERADSFYYLESGQVKTYMSSSDGNERILTVYKSGSILGEAAFFDGLPRMSTAVSLVRCRVSAIDRPAVLRCFQESPELALAMLKYLARTVRLLSDQLDGLSFQLADRRIARYILKLCGGRAGTISCAQEELGRAVGASRVTVSRILRVFAKEGWISTGYGKVTVLDTDGLASV